MRRLLCRAAWRYVLLALHRHSDQHRQLFECRRTYSTPRECSTKQNQLIRGLDFAVLRVLVAVNCQGRIESIEKVPTMPPQIRLGAEYGVATNQIRLLTG